MNTNSNTYTVIYSTILVVVVAAVLAFAATSLKEKQEENVKVDTISQILDAAGIKYNEGNVLQVYRDNIKEAILVDFDGNPCKEDLDEQNCDIYTTSQLKEQTVADEADKKLPVYIFKNDVTVVPCYGAGLWGPIWGYIGVNKDLTISKACFGHKGETPGLGAKITDQPDVFADNFANKTITTKIPVEKNGKDQANGVDTISGATITSSAAGKMVNKWLGFYQAYFKAEEQPCCTDCQEFCGACGAEGEMCPEECLETAEEVAVEKSNN